MNFARIVCVCATFFIPPLFAQGPADAQQAERKVEELLSAVVRIKAKALDDARSNATLGQSREGSGVVIDGDGYIVTIGYLVVEPEAIEVTTVANRTVPAQLVGYDHATGFGLLKAQGPLGVKPLALGDSANLAIKEPVMIVPAGGRDTASMAFVTSLRPFAGSWEYLLDSAIFTSPPSFAWAGAALVNRELKLVGVGSLLVRDTVTPGTPQPGNMFVPINILKPILADLKTKGRVAGAARPWLGMSTEEIEGQLFVTRVSPESPAEQAGVRRGDIVLGVGRDTVKNHVELYRKVWALGPAGIEVPLKLLSGVEEREVRVKSIDRFEYFREKRVL